MNGNSVNTPEMSVPMTPNVFTMNVKSLLAKGLAAIAVILALAVAAPATAAPQYRATASVNGSGTITYPGTVQAGDLMLLWVISTAAVTTPSGWSVTASHNWVAYGYRSYVFTKVKAADTSVNVTTNLGGAQLIAYSGTRGAGSVGAFAESAQGATTLALNSITPQSAASTVLGFITDRDVVALTPAAGFTSRATVNHTYFANQVADKGFGSTAPTGNQTWTQGNYYPAAGLLLELLPPLVPTLQAAYAPTTLITGGTATLTYTLTNPNSTPLTNVRFTANLGSVSVASTTLGGSCAGVTSSPALTVGASSLDLTVPTLAAGGCTISVQVTSSTLGSHGHAATGPTSNETDPGSAANTATVTVVTQPSPPTVTAKFEPAWMESGSQSTLRINLASPMNVALTNVNFTGTLTGMTVASATIGGTCAGVTNSPALAVGATSLNLTVPSLPASGCSVTVQVTSVTMGSNPVVMSGATSAESGGSGSAPPTFYLTVAEDPGFMYVHADHLGTPRAITRPSDNALVWKWDSVEPFGNNAANENPSGLGIFGYNLRHPGQYYDGEVNSFYNYHRDYDPNVGRYRQSDPIGLRGGLNTYGYVQANPLKLIDPSGLLSIHSSCNNCEYRSDFVKIIKGWCDTVQHIVTDPKLASCIKKRCEKAEIRCDWGRNCSPGDLGYNQVTLGFRSRNIYICAKNITNPNSLGAIAVHEWAHSCGWEHGDGKGVPGNSGEMKQNDFGPY